jgi:NAD(P)H dehydrogenase (quinone)
MSVIAVTGTTGKLGSRVSRLLARRDVDQVLVGRDPSRMPDLPGAERRGPAAYDDTGAMSVALAGADVVLVVSASLSGHRLHEHASVFHAAQQAGLERIVYVSLVAASPDATYVNARDHGDTERHLAGLDVPWTVLRPGFYASMLPGLASDDGEIRAPAADGRVAAVSHDDIAEVAVEVLLDGSGRYDGQVLDVTGPEALTLDEVATRLSAWSGRPHRYTRESEEDGLRWRRELDDVTEEQVQAWLSWHRAIARDEVSVVTDVVPALTGHPARPVEASWDTGEPQSRLR